MHLSDCTWLHVRVNAFKYSMPVSVCISVLVCSCMHVFDIAIKFIHTNNKEKGIQMRCTPD